MYESVYACLRIGSRSSLFMCISACTGRYFLRQGLSRLLLSMEGILQKVSYLKTMLVTPTSNDALLRALADLDGLGNIAPDVLKSIDIGTY